MKKYVCMDVFKSSATIRTTTFSRVQSCYRQRARRIEKIRFVKSTNPTSRKIDTIKFLGGKID
jgi:hypothetical protein